MRCLENERAIAGGIDVVGEFEFGVRGSPGLDVVGRSDPGGRFDPG